MNSFSIERIQYMMDLDEIKVVQGLVGLRDFVDINMNSQQHVEDGRVVELLRQLKLYGEEGMTTEEALEKIRKELDLHGKEGCAVTTEEVLKSSIEHLEDRIATLENENKFLKEELQKGNERFKKLVPDAPSLSTFLSRCWRRVYR